MLYKTGISAYIPVDNRTVFNFSDHLMPLILGYKYVLVFHNKCQFKIEKKRTQMAQVFFYFLEGGGVIDVYHCYLQSLDRLKIHTHVRT